MFIRSPNARAGTGFTGDVNTAFRQGRSDASRDYIDNFNVALNADANNYRFNQQIVNDTANNFDQQLGMGQAARKDTLDFVDKSSQLATDMTKADINFAKQGALQAQVPALGSSQANEVVFTQQGNEAKAQSTASEAMNKADNIDVWNQAATSQQQSNIASNNANVATQENNLAKQQTVEKMKLEASQKLARWQNADVLGNDIVQEGLAELEAKAASEGRPFDRVKEEQALRARITPEFIEQEQQRRLAEQQGVLNATIPPAQSKPRQAAQAKPTPPAEYSMQAGEGLDTFSKAEQQQFTAMLGERPLVMDRNALRVIWRDGVGNIHVYNAKNYEDYVKQGRAVNAMGYGK